MSFSSLDDDVVKDEDEEAAAAAAAATEASAGVEEAKRRSMASCLASRNLMAATDPDECPSLRRRGGCSVLHVSLERRAPVLRRLLFLFIGLKV